jgi:SAM-dependent methyltransferase
MDTWDDRYSSGELPWDTGVPDALLVETVQAGVTRGRALDIGCGTGTNAIWLAQNGFDVTGVDISPRAVERARAKLGDARLACRFAVHDILASPPEGPAFQFVFDRGCFHVFDEPAERARFAERVAAALAPDGLWLSLIGSTEGGPRDMGPPRRSVRDIADAIEPHLEIVSLRSSEFRQDPPVKAWICQARRRAVAAQPSTRH